MLFSYYQPAQARNGSEMVDLAVRTLQQRPPVPAAMSTQRSLYRDYLGMAIKVLNFISWNRPQPQVKNLVRHKEAIMEAIVWLLRHCPAEFVAHRKELLMASRYVLSSELRDGFLPHVDVMIEQRTLEGPATPCGSSVGYAPAEALRGTAYHLLSEVVSPLREKLSLQQLSCVVYLFSKNVHDPTLSLAVQTLSVRVILHLVDSVCRCYVDEPGQARRLITWILRTLVHKFEALIAHLPKLEAAERVRQLETEALQDKQQQQGSGGSSRAGSRGGGGEHR